MLSLNEAIIAEKERQQREEEQKKYLKIKCRQNDMSDRCDGIVLCKPLLRHISLHVILKNNV